MYVAITRARKFCMLSYAGSRFRNGQTATCRPSRFLGDINPAYLHLATNDRLGEEEPRFTRPTANYSASLAGSARSLSSLRQRPSSAVSARRRRHIRRSLRRRNARCHQLLPLRPQSEAAETTRPTAQASCRKA